MNKKQLACEAVLYLYTHPEEFEKAKLNQNHAGRFIKLDSNERFHTKEVLSKKFEVATGYITKMKNLYNSDREAFDFIHQTGLDIPRNREKGVYLVSSGSYDTSIPRPTKIGKTDSLLSRLSGIQTGCWLKLVVIRWLPSDNADTLEKYLHKQFIDKRLYGEWFDLLRQDLFIVDGIYRNYSKLSAGVKLSQRSS